MPSTFNAPRLTFPSVRPGPSAMPHSERTRGRRSTRRVINGRAVARRSEFLKKLSKKMTVRSASTINRLGGKSNEIQTHSNNGHNPPHHQSTPPPWGDVQLEPVCERGTLCLLLQAVETTLSHVTLGCYMFESPLSSYSTLLDVELETPKINEWM